MRRVRLGIDAMDARTPTRRYDATVNLANASIG